MHCYDEGVNQFVRIGAGICALGLLVAGLYKLTHTADP